MSTNTILASAPLTATGYHLKATGTTLGQSLIWDNGTNVGIGTTSPASPLTINATAGAAQFNITRSEQTNQGFSIQAGGGETTFNSYEGTNSVFGEYVFKSTKGSTTVERMRINGSGIVSLNAADATYISYSYLGTTKAFIGLAGASSDVISGAAAGDTVIRAQQSMRFSTGGDGERMRILSDFTLAGSGAGTGGPTQVIGTTSMCGILFVSIGTQNCAAIFIINAASAPVLVSQTTAETRFSITNDNGNTANVYVSGTDIVLRNNIQATRAFYCQFFGKL